MWYSQILKLQIPKVPLESFDRSEANYWSKKIQSRPDGEPVDVLARPDLHEHVFETQLGPINYDGFNYLQYREEKFNALQVPGTLLYEGPEYISEEEKDQQRQPQEQIWVTDNEGDIVLPEAPEVPQVLFTPNRMDYIPLQQMQGKFGNLKSNLKEHSAKYDDLGLDDKIASPFLWDTSDFIKEEEARQSTSLNTPIGTHAINTANAGHTPAVLPPHTKALRPNPMRSFQTPGATPGGHGQSRLRQESLFSPRTTTGVYTPKFSSPGTTKIKKARKKARPETFFGALAKQEALDRESTPSDEQNTSIQATPPSQGSPSLKRASPSDEEPVSDLPRQIFTARKKHTLARRTRPSATDLYPNLSANPEVRNPPTSPAPRDTEVRRIGGRSVWTLAIRATSLISYICNGIFNQVFRTFVEEQTEVTAVSTDMSDTKRRAVVREVGRRLGNRLQAQDVGTMPGNYSDDSESEEESVIPHAGNANDSDSEEEANMQHAGNIDYNNNSESQDDPAMRSAGNINNSDSEEEAVIPNFGNINIAQGQGPEAPESSEKEVSSQTKSVEQKKSVKTITPPESRPASKQEDQPAHRTQDTGPDMTSLKERCELMDRRAKGEDVSWSKSYPQMAHGSSHTGKSTTDDSGPTAELSPEVFKPVVKFGLGNRDARNRDSEASVNNLILRARAAAKLSPSEQRFQERQKLGKLRAAEKDEAKKREEKEKRAAEKAKVEAEKAKAELEKQREEIQRKVRQEEEEQQQKARQELEEARQKQEQEAAEKVLQDAIREQLIHPLDSHWDKRVANAMNCTNGKEVLAKSPDGTDLTRYTFGKVLPQKDANGESVEKNVSMGMGTGRQIAGWLDDEAVNAFIATIVSRKLQQTGYIKGPNNSPAFVAYNTAWYKVFTDKGVTGIKTWSRRKGIQGEKLLGAERIFFPLNTGAHWVLLIISPKDRKIEFLDSAGHKKERYTKIARDWLKMELGDKYHDDEWTDADSISNKQLNLDDCGVFTCMNALASAKNKAFGEVSVTTGMMDARRMIVAILLNGGFHGDWEL